MASSLPGKAGASGTPTPSHTGFGVWAVTGMLFVLYLIYNELIRIGQVCEYCTSVHIITFLLFALIVYQATAPAAPAPVAENPAQLPAKTAKGGARR